MKKRTVPILNSHPKRKRNGNGNRPFRWVHPTKRIKYDNGTIPSHFIFYFMFGSLHFIHSVLLLVYLLIGLLVGITSFAVQRFIPSFCHELKSTRSTQDLGTEPFTEPPIRTTATGTALGGGRRRLVGRCILHISPTKAEKESSPSIRITFGGQTGD